MCKEYNGYKITKTGDVINKKGRILKGEITNRNYRRVTLSIGGQNRRFSLHRLIAEVYISNPENKPCVNHKNGNTLDNRVENLEWCTYKENWRHAWETGLIKQKNKVVQCDYCGEPKRRFLKRVCRLNFCDRDCRTKYQQENIVNSRRITQVNLDGGIVNVFKSQLQAAKHLGFAQSSISAACRSNKTYKNYKWRFIDD